jgi:hypothetical protein
MSSIAKLISLASQLQAQDWTCEYHGKSYPAGKAIISNHAGVVTVKWNLALDSAAQDVIVGEHIEGGGDWLNFGGKQHDANHDIAFKWKLWPPSTKVIIKTEFDLDDKPGLEDMIKFATKLNAKII